MDHTRSIGNAIALEWHADRQVTEPVAVEIPCSQRESELVKIIGDAPHAVQVLVPELVAGRRDPGGRPEENVNRSRIGYGVQVLIWHTDGEVLVAVAVEVPDLQGPPEAIILLPHVRNIAAGDRRSLGDGLVARVRQPPGCATQHRNRACPVKSPEGHGRRADGELGTAVAVHVSCGKSRSESRTLEQPPTGRSTDRYPIPRDRSRNHRAR